MGGSVMGFFFVGDIVWRHIRDGSTELEELQSAAPVRGSEAFWGPLDGQPIGKFHCLSACLRG